MLVGLSVRDIVLIDKLDLTLASGLCALTGETGAGKSILLDALGLAIGARADAGLVASGADNGSVTAIFDIPSDHRARAHLRENGLEAEGEIILRRQQSRDGRSRAFINDQPVSVGLLRDVGELLVEIHGQHAERGLLDAAGHRAILDAFAGLEPKVEEIRRLHAGATAAAQALRDHEAMIERARAEQEYLTHVVAELDELDPQPDEETELARERTLMMQSEKVAGDLVDAQNVLFGNGGLEAGLTHALRRLARAAAETGGRLDGALAALDRTLNEAGEARDELERAMRALEFDPARLEQVETRLFALRAAARKHKVTVDRLAPLADKYRADLREIEDGEARRVRLAVEADKARKAYGDAARALSAARQKAAVKLDAEVARELKPLKLDKATFKTSVVVMDEAGGTGGPEGIDRVSFLIATNPGAALGPLIKIASGGELSRFILALKVALASRGTAPTLIFDEVDSGVGGAVAEAVGLRLAALSTAAQILVVTHSPQVAARASHHYRISKNAARNARLATRIETLDALERREEIARMLAGATITDEARAAADRLIRSDA